MVPLRQSVVPARQSARQLERGTGGYPAGERLRPRQRDGWPGNCSEWSDTTADPHLLDSELALLGPIPTTVQNIFTFTVKYEANLALLRGRFLLDSADLGDHCKGIHVIVTLQEHFVCQLLRANQYGMEWREEIGMVEL